MTNERFYELIGKDNYFYTMFKEVTYCNELSVMRKLIYAWQQQVNDFLKYTPKELIDYFISHFEDYDGRDLYRIITLKNDDVLYKEKRKLISATTDIKTFDELKKNWINSGIKVKHIYFKVTGEKMLNVQKYRNLGEEEYIIYNPNLFILKDMK